MSANLKIALALAVLIAAVVGITIITQFTDAERPTTGKPKELLSYKETTLQYDPTSTDYATREFPGFFEVNSQTHWGTFLLRNTDNGVVKLTATWRSCTACTQARVAVLTADESRAMKRDAALAAATGGLVIDPETALYRRAEADQLDWKPLPFDKPDAVTVPPAVDPTTPTWCVLQLGFEVKGPGANELAADIGMQSEGMPSPLAVRFKVHIFGDPGERVWAESLNFGTLGERTESKSLVVYYFSTTRPPDRFPPPDVGGLTGDPFLSKTDPVPLTPAELEYVAARNSHKARSDKERDFYARVRGGYKFTLTLRRDNPTPTGPRELDIGPLERRITVGSQQLQFSATVTGLVALSEGTAVHLGDFPGRAAAEKEFRLTSSREKLDLQPINSGTPGAKDTNPPGVTVKPVGEPVVAAGLKVWTFNVSVAPNAFSGPLTDRLLVFLVKDTGQLVRIPLRGNAR